MIGGGSCFAATAKEIENNPTKKTMQIINKIMIAAFICAPPNKYFYVNVFVLCDE